MKHEIIFFLLIVAMVSCNNDDNRKSTGEQYGNDSTVRPLTIPADMPLSSVAVVDEGDTLHYMHLNEGSCEEEMDFMLPYALVMSMKYSHINAFLDVYYSLNPKFDLHDVDPTTLRLIQFCEFKLRQSETYQDYAKDIVDSFTRDSVAMNPYKGNGLFEYLMSAFDCLQDNQQNALSI